MRSYLILLSVLLCAYSSYALKCYVCDSTLKSDCADPFDKTKFTDADQMEVSANGVCVKTKVSGGSVAQYDRIGSEDKTLCIGGANGCKSASAGGASGAVCCCTTDLCNSAQSIGYQSLFLTILSSLLVVAYRLM